ncbi:MAG: transposase [Pseudomonadota bacterium]
MARLPRLSLPGYPQHIIQRGNNRQAIATSATNYQTLLALIDENARKFSVAVHAYVLMDNHFHLLATPETADGVPQLMQATGRRYVRYFNDSQGRTGTLWEGRYRSTVIQAERYLLACMAYIDLNPVRHGLVVQARDYPWSSHGHYAGLRVDRLVTPHPQYWSLGNTPFAREAAYDQMVNDGVPADQQLALTQSALSGWALGDPAFMAELQMQTPRRVSKVSAGRPPKKQSPGAQG